MSCRSSLSSAGRARSVAPEPSCVLAGAVPRVRWPESARRRTVATAAADSMVRLAAMALASGIAMNGGRIVTLHDPRGQTIPLARPLRRNVVQTPFDLSLAPGVRGKRPPSRRARRVRFSLPKLVAGP
jgi:hypothetical protein